MSDWEGDEYLAQLHKRLERNLEAALIHFKASVQQAIQQTQPRKRYSGLTGVFYKGLAPSAPNYPPKIVSAQLVRSIDYEITRDKLEGRVGSGMGYAFFLEMGTSKMAPRPFLSTTLTTQQTRLEEILTKE